MKFFMRYGSIILFFIYGFLLEEDIYKPSRGTGNGFGFIIVGMLLLFFNFYMEYLEFKDNKQDVNIKESKNLIDYFCVLFGIFGLIYFGLFLFEIVTNYFIFIGIVLYFALCGKSMRKFV